MTTATKEPKPPKPTKRFISVCFVPRNCGITDQDLARIETCTRAVVVRLNVPEGTPPFVQKFEVWT